MTDKQKVYSLANYIVNSEIEILRKINLENIIQEIRNIILMRDLSYVKRGETLWWQDPFGETSGYYTVVTVNMQNEEYVVEDDIIVIANDYSEAEVYARELYKPTGTTCERCGEPLFYSDLPHYKTVCLKCDENFQ